MPDNARPPGAPPYPPCDSSSERKHLKAYELADWTDSDGFTVEGGVATLYCGHRGYGLEHITGRHRDDWSNMAGITRGPWRTLLDYSMEATLRHPEQFSIRTTKDGTKRCYARKIWMYDKRNGQMRGHFWSNVIVRDGDLEIITAYPSTGKDSRCA